MTKSDDPTNIHPDLQHLATDIEELNELPDNPRIGDLGAVMDSYQNFGQRKPIVVRKADNVVIAGNHQLEAARHLGWTKIAAVVVDDDEARSVAFALADNRTSSVGREDVTLLVEMLDALDAESKAMAGYSEAEEAALKAAFAAELSKEISDADLNKLLDDVQKSTTRKQIIIEDVPADLYKRWLALGDSDLERLEVALGA